MHGEFIATLSLVESCRGRPDHSEALATQAEMITRSTEARALVLWARTIAEIVRGSVEGANLTIDAFVQTGLVGCWDYFVCAYRGYPQLLRLLSHDPHHQPELIDILTEARDLALAKRIGVDLLPHPPDQGDALTKREREVYELLLQGLSNREIAQILFISDATAKLHVRHILAKLGVRTRTEAALLSRKG
jgi:ATP/maltotriose-dependent transcriptional regulator MalT